jgi:hypothetical protein
MYIVYSMENTGHILWFLAGLLQVEYRKDHDNRSEVVTVKTVSATSASMQLSEIDVNGSARIYNVSVPLTLLKMDSYKKLLSALNASFHCKYSDVRQCKFALRHCNDALHSICLSIGIVSLLLTSAI